MIDLLDALDAVDKRDSELRECMPTMITKHIGGSTAITGEGNDADVIILLPSGSLTQDDWQNALVAAGWEVLGEESYNSCGNFISFRKGLLNLIVCDEQAYYDNWLVARAVCQYLHAQHSVTGRDVRVAIHKMIVDGAL